MKLYFSRTCAHTMMTMMIVYWAVSAAKTQLITLTLVHFKVEGSFKVKSSSIIATKPKACNHSENWCGCVDTGVLIQFEVLIPK